MKPTEEDIIQFLGRRATKPLKTKDLARSLDVPQEGYAAFRRLLAEMVERGLVYRVKGQRYALPDRLNLAVGRLQVVKSGAGFVVPEDASHPDVFVPAYKLETGVHGDRVVTRIEKHPPGSNPEGRVIRVLERARSRVVGTFRRSRHFGFVQPDDPKLTFDVYVSVAEGAEPEEGQKVLVQIDDWGDAHKNPEGTVLEILGFPDDPGVDVLSIIHHHGLEPEFPPDVEAEAEALPVEIPARELRRRVDLRDALCFTIDPLTARDFDDALSIEPAGADWEVGIHVADVSQYVEPGTALDREAQRRATSVYLVDRVIPMLPEKLSNHLCSLNPGEDKLAVSVLVTVDASGEIHASRTVESVIRSKARLTYQEAQALIEGERLRGRPAEIAEAVVRLRDLSRELLRRRTERGSLDFDLPEADVVLDEEGFPIDIQQSVRLDSHRLIEEFMLLANEIVARRGRKRRVPFVYRVHEEPDPLRLEHLRRFAAVFGHVIPPGEVSPGVLQRMLRRVEGRPEEQLLNLVVLRSMKQARYSVENVGHFGLASDCYTHFTSPIRRYPDLLVHRIVKDLETQAAETEERKEEERRKLGRLAEHASGQERVAQEAERDSVDLKKVQFMERHLGDVFAGTISGVQAFGFFVRLHRYFVEGLVHVNRLDDDYYIFAEELYSLVGQNTGRTFRLGDEVQVKVARVDRGARQIDFLLLDGELPPDVASKPRTARGRRERVDGGGRQRGGGRGRVAGPVVAGEGRVRSGRGQRGEALSQPGAPAGSGSTRRRKESAARERRRPRGR